jgi:hypothetical protein
VAIQNGTRNALLQLFGTAIFAALAAFIGIKVGITEMKTAQTAMEKRLDRMEDKLDRLTYHTMNGR